MTHLADATNFDLLPPKSYHSFFSSPTPTFGYDDPFKKVQEQEQEQDLLATQEEIESISNWEASWDHNPKKPSNKTIDRAKDFAKLLIDAIISGQYDWSHPNITASEDGEVAFEWWNDPKKLTIYISDAEIIVIKVEGEHISQMKDERIEVPTKDMLQQIWKWLQNSRV